MKFKDSDFLPSMLHRTEEGYLTGRIRCTCSGVFRYLDKDGNIVRVLRSDTEVGNLSSVNSANSKPVTLQHPKDMVNAGNVKKYEVGFTGTDAEFIEGHLWLTITVTDPKAIAAIENGEVAAVSMGYDCELSDVDDPLANWRGTEYTKEQHGIRYNHLALVYAGRAGESVEITVGDCIDDLTKPKTAGHEPAKDNAMKKIIIDGAVYEADEAVASKIAGLEKQLGDSAAAHKAELDTVTAERDSAKVELEKMTAARDTAQAELETLKEKQLDGAEIAKRVADKIALVEKAKGYGCEVKAEDADIDIKKAVISKAVGDKLSLEGKSEEYVAAAFDSACATLDSGAGEGDERSPFTPNYAGIKETGEYNTDSAYQAMKDKLAGKAAKEA